jgi:hypothetical protein
MLTSYYAKQSKFHHPGSISISRSQGQYSYPVYSPLAPNSSCFKAPIAEYIPRYQSQLNKLNPKAVWAEIQQLAIDAAIHRFGMAPQSASMVEPVIMCWEKNGATPDSFCHRRLVAQWLQTELGVMAPEGYIDAKGERRLTPNFDTLCRIDPDGTFHKLDKETNQGQGTLQLF